MAMLKLSNGHGHGPQAFFFFFFVSFSVVFFLLQLWRMGPDLIRRTLETTHSSIAAEHIHHCVMYVL
jgi:hypothetical protein